MSENEINKITYTPISTRLRRISISTPPTKSASPAPPENVISPIDSPIKHKKTNSERKKATLWVASHSPSPKTVRKLPGLAKATSKLEKLKMIVVVDDIKKKIQKSSEELGMETEMSRIPLVVTKDGKPIQRPQEFVEQDNLKESNFVKALMEVC